jgi:hypothetical protein
MGLNGKWLYRGDVWAFRVTMLYVARLIPIPTEYWLISDLTNDLNTRRKMRICVTERVRDVGIWTYGEQPCYQRLRPTGGNHATRGCGLLVAARSSWKHVDGGRLRQSGSMAKH